LVRKWEHCSHSGNLVCVGAPLPQWKPGWYGITAPTALVPIVWEQRSHINDGDVVGAGHRKGKDIREANCQLEGFPFCVVNFVTTLYSTVVRLLSIANTAVYSSLDIFPYPYDIRAFLLPIQKTPAPIAPVTCPGTLGRSRYTLPSTPPIY